MSYSFLRSLWENILGYITLTSYQTSVSCSYTHCTCHVWTKVRPVTLLAKFNSLHVSTYISSAYSLRRPLPSPLFSKYTIYWQTSWWVWSHTDLLIIEWMCLINKNMETTVQSSDPYVLSFSVLELFKGLENRNCISIHSLNIYSNC